MIFVDTWAWVALSDRSDPYHRVAKLEHRNRRKRRDLYVTTDWVLGETITYLYDALPAQQARSFINSLISAANTGHCRLVRLTHAQFDRAWGAAAEVFGQAGYLVCRFHIDGGDAGLGHYRGVQR